MNKVSGSGGCSSANVRDEDPLVGVTFNTGGGGRGNESLAPPMVELGFKLTSGRRLGALFRDVLGGHGVLMPFYGYQCHDCIVNN